MIKLHLAYSRINAELQIINKLHYGSGTQWFKKKKKKDTLSMKQKEMISISELFCSHPVFQEYRAD